MDDGATRLRLFVAGDSLNSREAVHNLERYCGDRFDFEVVDVLDRGHEALDEQIWVTPTLVIDRGDQTHRVIGTLSDSTVLERMLDRPPAPHSTAP